MEKHISYSCNADAPGSIPTTLRPDNHTVGMLPGASETAHNNSPVAKRNDIPENINKTLRPDSHTVGMLPGASETAHNISPVAKKNDVPENINKTLRPDNDTVGMLRGASGNTHNNSLVTEKNDAPGSIHTTLPKRKSLRAEFHDYSGGIYFVTICTREKKHYFGSIKAGEMSLTDIGKHAVKCLERLKTHYTYVEVPQYVVMPNHIHAIIVIRERADAPGSIPTTRMALGVVVGGFKQSVTCYARRNGIEFGWQSRFHDHIIRGVNDGNKISDYIDHNIVRWDTDCFNT